MSVDKSNLGKLKYIYRVYSYSSGDGIFHCEKYPVVYLNSNVVYFKTSRKNEILDRVNFQLVEDEFLGIDKLSSYGYYNYNRYFWKCDNFDSKKVNEIFLKNKQDIKINDTKRKMLELEYDYLKKKKEYENLIKEQEVK